MKLEQWLEINLPAEFKTVAVETILWMPNWKWSLLGISLALVFLVFHPLFYFSIKLVRKWFFGKQKNKEAFLAYLLESKIESSLAWLFTSLLQIAVINSLALVKQVAQPLLFIFNFVVLISIILFVFRAIEAIELLFIKYARKTESRMDDMLAPFIAKSMKGAVIVLGFLVFLQNSGINVVSVLAGLGLGGLALALAAQDTAANIFGSITIFLDQPFRVGDAIKVQDTEGTVESIGFRSTRIRTFYNSLVTIPNSVVAKEKIDNLGVRPSRRIRHTLGVTYDTTATEIESFCEGLRYIAAQLPQTVKDSVTVVFNGYGESSLNILVNFHIEVPELKEELAVQQQFLLEVLKLAEAQKIDFAFPTRTLQIARENLTGLSPS